MESGGQRLGGRGGGAGSARDSWAAMRVWLRFSQPDGHFWNIVSQLRGPEKEGYWPDPCALLGPWLGLSETCGLSLGAGTDAEGVKGNLDLKVKYLIEESHPAICLCAHNCSLRINS